jgi:hypothetical protein
MIITSMILYKAHAHISIMMMLASMLHSSACLLLCCAHCLLITVLRVIPYHDHTMLLLLG